MNKLSKMLSKRLSETNMSVRRAGLQIGVSHATVARAVNGETVEVDTLVRIADFLGVSIISLLDETDTPDDVYERISVTFTIEPELKTVLADIARNIKDEKIDHKILSDVAIYTLFQLHRRLTENHTRS